MPAIVISASQDLDCVQKVGSVCLDDICVLSSDRSADSRLPLPTPGWRQCCGCEAGPGQVVGTGIKPLLLAFSALEAEMALLSETCMENTGPSRLYDTSLSLPDFFKPPLPLLLGSLRFII